MFNIVEYLEKFSKQVKEADSYKSKIIDIIQRHTQLQILPKYLEIKDGTIHIQDSPAVKNKIFIEKQKILDEITNSIPLKIVDIR